ncbi:MAG: redox-sensing transcriptional repressor Rex [Lentimicrobiaceae bacterium]|jgi:redox-sensing transcriptional repressor|nr:redox-sensing transcriptional repressor Rex [Lentimicrobiaceae bacterium]MDD4597457.1 redox-sensing transcriptional repressor Rex [Lentimicrobiaceae bacterium]HAH59937.1 redox-sensing transcriptional repressor Rex [Bacteroidales bacterium]
MSPDNLTVSLEEFKRMERYISLLKLLKLRGRTDISLNTITEELGLSRELVEADLQEFGLSLAGQYVYNISKLASQLEEMLGYRNDTEAFLVGAGKLGTSLLLKENLGQTDLKIVAAFDNDHTKIGNTIGSVRVMSPDKIISLAERMHICVGLIATPPGEAQHIANIFCGAGIKAIWNFTSDEIEVAPGIIVENTRIGQDLKQGYLHLIEQLNKR